MPKPGRKVWHLRIHGCNYQVVRRMDVDEGEEIVERPHLSSSTFDRWLREAATARRLSDMLSAVTAIPSRNSLENKGWLSARLEEAFRRGLLVLLAPEEEPVTVPITSSGGGGQNAQQEQDAPAPTRGGAGASPAPTKTWIEFKLVDNNGKAIPNERYKVKLTDGTISEGHLSASGTVRFSGIDPGNCDISFPDLDARDWTAA